MVNKSINGMRYMTIPKLLIEFLEERFITLNDLFLVGQMLGKSRFIKNAAA